MNYYKAILQYDGTNYFGFQWQKDIPTIQDTLNQSLAKLIGGKITTMGASRTDTGVHALEQFVKISCENEIDCDHLITELNKSLSPQVKCLSLVPCEGTFKPAMDSVSKEYRYLFTNISQTNCSDQKFITNNPFSLDFDLMKKCAEMMVGEHDFKNFYSTASDIKTTTRDILLCELSEVDPHTVLPQIDLFLLPQDLRRCYQLRIVGNGFLKQMVRHIMSAIWAVGRGKISLEEFSSLLNGPKQEKKFWKVASPRGLYLYKINTSKGVF